MEKRLILLDQSSMKLSHCGRKLWLSNIEGYRSKFKDQAQEFGQAFHIFSKELELLENSEKAIQKALAYYRSSNYVPDSRKKYLTDMALLSMCDKFFDKVYQNDSFEILRDFPSEKFPKGEPLVEKRFAIDIYESDIIKVLMCGTMDMIKTHTTSKLLAIPDYKTSATWEPEKFFTGYKTNCQLPVYTWALKKLIDDCSTASVLYPFKGKQIASFIQGIFYKAPLKDSGVPIVVDFQKSPIEFFDAEWQLKELESEMLKICLQIESMVVNGRPVREGIYNGTCYGCSFASAVCPNEGDSMIQQHMLDMHFNKQQYNPMGHGE